MCQGSGELRQVQQTFLGSVVRMSPCPQCGGKGVIIKSPCGDCHGSGRLRQRIKRVIQIPAGVREGLQIQVRDAGDVAENPSVSAGNLFVAVRVKDHEFFKRRDNDIILDVNINISQAALGDKLTIETLDEEIDMNIPAGTQTGWVYRKRGLGAPRLRNDGSNTGRGDLLIYVTVVTPKNLTEEQQLLFEQLADTFGSEVHPQNHGRGFFDRVMDFFSGEEE